MHEWLLERVDSQFDALLALALFAAGAHLKRRFGEYRKRRRQLATAAPEPLPAYPEEAPPQPLLDRIFDFDGHAIPFEDRIFVPDRDPIAAAATGREERSAGRNDPCWCGSGRKYKRCHGA